MTLFFQCSNLSVSPRKEGKGQLHIWARWYVHLLGTFLQEGQCPNKVRDAGPEMRRMQLVRCTHTYIAMR